MIRSSMTRRSTLLLTVLMLSCASEKEVLTSTPVATALPPVLDGGEPTVIAADGMTGLDASVPVRTLLDASLAAADAGAREDEVCDGEDNDGNGVVDDVDVGHDGVCDCLMVATLGYPGGSGEGDVFGRWLDTRSGNGAADLGGQTLTPELLSRYQVIVAQDLHNLDAYTAQEIDALEAWVHAGGGLLTLIGYASPDERGHVNQILARFGMSYGETPILMRTADRSVPVTEWVPHPVTTGIERIGVDNGYPVEGGGTRLASAAGHDLLKVQEVGDGHLIVWGDEWITYDSEWENDSDYQVEQLWLNMIKWLTVSRVCQVPPPALL